MNTTSPSPPGFVWIGSINQLLVTQTLPDGSMDTPRVSHQSVAVVAVRRNRLTGLISGRVVFRLRVAKFGDPLPAEGSDPDVIVSVDRDAPGDHDSAAFVRLCTHWVPVGIEFRDGCLVEIGCQIAIILCLGLSGARNFDDPRVRDPYSPKAVHCDTERRLDACLRTVRRYDEGAVRRELEQSVVRIIGNPRIPVG